MVVEIFAASLRHYFTSACIVDCGCTKSSNLERVKAKGFHTERDLPGFNIPSAVPLSI